MPISPYIAKLREKVGHDLLLLPSACVLPKDEHGRILLVKEAHMESWETIGGAIEPDEAPGAAATREAKEEAGIDVELTLLAVLGGPGHVVSYPNGDRCQYVSAVYEARIVSGEPSPDHEETTDVRWFSRDDLVRADLGPHCRAVLGELGYLD